jgi:hypothetical protein
MFTYTASRANLIETHMHLNSRVSVDACHITRSSSPHVTTLESRHLLDYLHLHPPSLASSEFDLPLYTPNMHEICP